MDANTYPHPLPDIALTGAAGAGKDTVADILGFHFGYTRIAFADPVRACLLALDPKVTNDKRVSDIVDRCGWEQAKRSYPEIRALLQRFGTDAIREIAPEFWIDCAFGAAMLTVGPVVFTDTRFDNEVDAAREMGGYHIHVEREVAPVVGHVSERSITRKPDHIIWNIGTLLGLEAVVVDLVADIVDEQCAS